MGGRVSRKREHRRGRLGGDDRKLHHAGRHAGLVFERVEVMADAHEVGAAASLGDHHGVETGFHDVGEIGQRQP